MLRTSSGSMARRRSSKMLGSSAERPHNSVRGTAFASTAMGGGEGGQVQPTHANRPRRAPWSGPAAATSLQADRVRVRVRDRRFKHVPIQPEVSKGCTVRGRGARRPYRTLADGDALQDEAPPQAKKGAHAVDRGEAVHLLLEGRTVLAQTGCGAREVGIQHRRVDGARPVKVSLTCVRGPPPPPPPPPPQTPPRRMLRAGSTTRPAGCALAVVRSVPHEQRCAYRCARRQILTCGCPLGPLGVP